VSSLSFDPVADRYDATRGGTRRGRYVADLLVPWLPGDGTVCEIGVGTALVAAAMAERGITVVGVDISAGMLARATERLAGRVARADAAALRFADGSLAGVSAVWVFHVVGDPGGVLASCARALRPGGRVVAVVADESRRISHPRLESLERKYRRRQDVLDHLDPMATAAGFRAVHVEPLATFRRPTTAVELANHLEQRMWSWLWDLPPGAWEAEVEPVIAALRAEPDAAQPRPHQNAHLLAVWDR